MAAFRTILHPTDFSTASSAAFARAVELAKDNRATLVLAHVLVPSAPMIGDGYVSPAAFEAIQAAARGGAEKGLARLAARARKAGVRVRTLLLHGLAHEEIVRAARARRADVIVMGTHGRTGVGRLFLGSVAERVVARARCPVMTVRGGTRRARR